MAVTSAHLEFNWVKNPWPNFHFLLSKFVFPLFIFFEFQDWRWPIRDQRWSHLKTVCPSPRASHLTGWGSHESMSVCPYCRHPRWGSSWSPRIHLGPLANLLSSWYQDTCCDANLGRDALPTPFIGALGNVHTPCLVWSLLLQHQASLSSCSTLLSPAPGYPAHDLTSPGMLLSPSLPYCLDFLQSSAQCLLSRESCFSRTGKLPLKEACAARWSSFFPALLTGPHQLRSDYLIITSNSSSIPSVFPFFLYSSLSLSLFAPRWWYAQWLAYSRYSVKPFSQSGWKTEDGYGPASLSS